MSRRMLSLGVPHVFGLVLAFAVGVAPGVAHAHFTLSQPPNWTKESSQGNPQKEPPCGNENMAMATGPTTPFMAGEEITITLSETIAHDGHYRVAISSGDMMDLPADMSPDASGATCQTDDMKATPEFPILADGMLEHTGTLSGPQSFKVKLPDMSCDKCVLQVREWMKGHSNASEIPTQPNGCYYHHCAFISISGGTSGAGGMGSGGMGAGAGGASAGAGPGGMGPVAGNGGSVAQGGVMGGAGMPSAGGVTATGGAGGTTGGSGGTTGGTGGTTGGTGGTAMGGAGDANSSGGSGGAGGSGGSGAAGGSSGTGVGGSGATAGAPSGTPTGSQPAADDQSGCGCRVPARGPSKPYAALALGLGLWLARRRRRS